MTKQELHSIIRVVNTIFTSISAQPIECVFEESEEGSPLHSPNIVNRTESEVLLVQNKEEARLRSRSALSSAESTYDIPGAVSGKKMN